jgi:hypothetical protein
VRKHGAIDQNRPAEQADEADEAGASDGASRSLCACVAGTAHVSQGSGLSANAANEHAQDMADIEKLCGVGWG